jgi:uncharacterized protein (UPF0261 family)
MQKTVVVLSTLDTKGQETGYLKSRIELCGARPLIMDMGVLGSATIPADLPREKVAEAGGSALAALIESPSRETAAPVMIRGATRLVLDLIEKEQAHAVLGIGGTQGTSNCCEVMKSLPFGFPKLMVSTCAAGDTSTFIGVKDIAMMFSVSDILGLNPFMRKVLANASAAACGMANQEPLESDPMGTRPVVGITNLGVLTQGTMIARDYFERQGFEVIIFHAVGAGGRAMEQMIQDGLIHAVFDYALGDVADEVFGALRAGGPDRLTTAGRLGIPQVICPGGTEHIGIFLKQPLTLPKEYSAHQNVFHSPVIAAPRLKNDELIRVAQEIGRRLQSTKRNAVFMIPLRGVSRYSIPGGPLHNTAGDQVYFDALRANLPDSVEVVDVDAAAEDELFVHACCDRLVKMLAQGQEPIRKPQSAIEKCQ